MKRKEVISLLEELVHWLKFRVWDEMDLEDLPEELLPVLPLALLMSEPHLNLVLTVITDTSTPALQAMGILDTVRDVFGAQGPEYPIDVIIRDGSAHFN